LLAQQAEQGLAERRFGLQERELGMREAAANAPPQSKWTGFETKKNIGKKEYTARVRQNQLGVIEGSDGKYYRTIDDYWAGKPMDEFSAGDEFALPSGGADPNAGAFLPSRTSRADGTPTGDTMPIAGNVPTLPAAQQSRINASTPDPYDFDATEPQEAARQIEGALEEGEVYIPPGAVETSKPEGQRKTFRRATPQEAAEYGVAYGQFDSDGKFFPIRVPSGMSIESDGQGGIKVVQGPGVGSPKEAIQQKALARSAITTGAMTLRDTSDAIEGIMKTNPKARALASKGGALDILFAGSEVYDTVKLIETVKASIAIAELINLRQTGTTLGQVPQRQLEMLSTLMGNLDQNMGNERLVKVLNDIYDTYGFYLNETIMALPEEERNELTPAMREFNRFRSALKGRMGEPTEADEMKTWFDEFKKTQD
jgi:hypothetical protein